MSILEEIYKDRMPLLREAQKWWRGLSINEQNSLIDKYFPYYTAKILVCATVSCIIEMYEREVTHE